MERLLELDAVIALAGAMLVVFALAGPAVVHEALELIRVMRERAPLESLSLSRQVFEVTLIADAEYGHRLPVQPTYLTIIPSSSGVALQTQTAVC